MKVLTLWHRATTIADVVSRFRPLSGMKVLTLSRQPLHYGGQERAFPSPLGDEGLNTRTDWNIVNYKIQFPSPLVDEGINT